MASGGVERLRRRADYLRVQAAERRVALPGLLLQAAPGETGCRRVGFTASRKVGNAVARNRARRRLKALVSEILPLHAMPGHDYVLVARPAAYDRAFPDLKKDLERALQRVHHPAAASAKGGTSQFG